jgi:pimeloyl-ACP methyl ester carboxylesterase
MSHRWRTAGVIAGVAGAIATGAVIGTVTRGRRRKRDSPRFGDLAPDRTSTVQAEDGVDLHVMEVDPADGEPELTVIFVHGFVLDSRMWYYQRTALPELDRPKVRTVLYDQRSHGRSGHSSRRGSTIEQLGRDLDAVLQAKVQHGPIVLVGHSMGAMTIMALAEHRPELFAQRVAGVALLCTSAGDLANMRLARPFLGPRSPVLAVSAMTAARRPALVEWTRRVGADAGRPLIRTLAFGVQRPAPELLDLMDRMIGRVTVEVMTDFLRTLGEHNRFRALAGLRHCHVLVLGGDADRITPWTHTQALAAALPDAELVRLEGAGHMAPLERPDEVNEHLMSLVKRCQPVEPQEKSPKKRRGR